MGFPSFQAGVTACMSPTDLVALCHWVVILAADLCNHSSAQVEELV